MSGVWVVIQARLGSTRWPRKVLHRFNGDSMIAHVVKACKTAWPRVAVAIPEGEVELREEVSRFGVPCIEGHSTDVLARYLWTCEEVGALGVVRITGDCPFMDPLQVNAVARRLQLRQEDFVTNAHPTLRTSPDGYDAEGMNTGLVRMICDVCTDPYEREHVTAWLYRHWDSPLFTKISLDYPFDASGIKVSIDTREELEEILAGKYSMRAKFLEDES